MAFNRHFDFIQASPDQKTAEAAKKTSDQRAISIVAPVALDADNAESSGAVQVPTPGIPPTAVGGFVHIQPTLGTMAENVVNRCSSLRLCMNHPPTAVGGIRFDQRAQFL